MDKILRFNNLNNGIKTGFILFFAILLLSNVARADISQYKLGCNSTTPIGVSESTDLSCNEQETGSIWTGLLNNYGTSDTRIHPRDNGNYNQVYAHFVNNSTYLTDVNVTAYGASIHMSVIDSNGAAGKYELGYYNPEGSTRNFVHLFNSTENTTSYGSANSFNIDFGGQKATIPAGMKLAVRVWMRTTSGSNRPIFYTYASSKNSSFFADITPVTVSKSDQTITFGALGAKNYGDADFSVSATASSGLAVSFAASGTCTVTGSSVHITGAGSCTITANQSGNASYKAAPDVTQSFTITQASSSVTVTCPASETYTGSAITPCTATYSDVGGLGGSVTPTYSNNLAVGTATASAIYAGDTNHTGSSNSTTFGITLASSSVTVTCPASETYTGSAITPCTATYSGDGGLGGSVTPTYLNNLAVGTATASAIYAGDANHTGSSNSTTFDIVSVPTYSVSGYVFNNLGEALGGVFVQNNSNSDTTLPEGYYSISGLINGTYNFSYSKAWFDTDYLEIIIGGANVVNANKTIYDTTPPASVKDLANVSYAQTYINWTWTDSVDADFNHVEIYLDGIQKPNVLAGVQYYNASVLAASTTHEISTRTVDNSGNVNATWKNHTSTTAPIPDTSEPSNLTGLTNITYAQTYINWTWTDPADSNFSKVMIYINGTFKINVTKGKQYYNATGLALNKSYEISTRTVNTSGNINHVWKNHTAKTAPGRVHNINKGIDYINIQSAIAGANISDEIHVDGGIYYEIVNVNRQVIMMGENTNDSKTVVDARRIGNAITLSANGITLNGFTAINASNPYAVSNPYAGIRVNSNNNILIGNNASNNNNGIQMERSSNNNITGNIASSNNLSGIRLSYSNNNTIRSNIFSNNGNYGIALTTSSLNTISNNIVSFNNYSSLFLGSSNDNTIYNNIFNNKMELSTLDINNNRLNTTKAPGTNIIGGPYFGGNLWTNPDGTGFSQTCTDANNDWICDTSYLVATGNIDYHPLVQSVYISGIVMNNNNGIEGAIITTNTSITAVANASGVYSLRLDPGTYNLTVTKEPEFYSNISVVVDGKAITTVAQDIELIRKPTGNITGSVTG